ncbi:hypothetical protein [Kitasatospora sp. NBC_00315]|uniref:hypothetical protein n=1 Tax=Kitasatospora sp. NBC_00315 TaxID=2975963 RepID=UPI0032442987
MSALGVRGLQDDDEEEYQETVEPPVPAGLDQLTAPHLLADLRDACDHVGRAPAFRQCLSALREEHQRLPGLLRRLDEQRLRG